MIPRGAEERRRYALKLLDLPVGADAAAVALEHALALAQDHVQRHVVVLAVLPIREEERLADGVGHLLELLQREREPGRHVRAAACLEAAYARIGPHLVRRVRLHQVARHRGAVRKHDHEEVALLVKERDGLPGRKLDGFDPLPLHGAGRVDDDAHDARCGDGTLALARHGDDGVHTARAGSEIGIMEGFQCKVHGSFPQV